MLKKVTVLTAVVASALLSLLAWVQPASASGTQSLGSGVATSAQFGAANQTDVFSANSSGALTVAWVEGAGSWQGPTPITANGDFPSDVGIATSQQFGAANQTDVFAVNNSGALTVTWIEGAGSWAGPTAISPNGTFPPGTAVAASQQFGAANQTDVFAVNNSGALTVTFVEGAGSWLGPTSISPDQTFQPGGGVAASQQFGAANQTDVFAVDNTGALTVTWIEGAGSWSGPTQIGFAGTFYPGSDVAASQQFGAGNQTDVFVVDESGALEDASVQGAGSWQGPGTITGPDAFGAGSSIAASAQFGAANQTDVFGVGGSGALNVVWVEGAGTWTGPTPIGGDVFQAGDAVAASQQFGISNQTDVFAIDNSGALNNAWVQGAGSWQGPGPI